MNLEIYIKQLNETMQEFVKLKEEKEQNKMMLVLIKSYHPF